MDNEEIQKLRRSVLLVTPMNDAESIMIGNIARALSIKTIVSRQDHGASLDLEPNIVERIGDIALGTVWIVEIPGPATERAITATGREVCVIDHHRYGKDLDRSHGADGSLLPSALAQFLTLTKVTDRELAAWGWGPKTVRGLGIFDASYARGLREAGYMPNDIKQVIALRNLLLSGFIGEDFDAQRAAAREAWKSLEVAASMNVWRAQSRCPIRAEFGILSIEEDFDYEPNIVVEYEGRQIFVQNVDPRLVEYLLLHVKGKTFSYGDNRNFGVDNTKGHPHWTSTGEVIAAIENFRNHPTWQ